MAVPPVLSSTSAECSLQEVKGCTMAQSVWHAAKSAGCNRDVVEVHQLLPKASESRKVESLGKQVTQIFGGVNVYGFDKLRVTQHLDPLRYRAPAILNDLFTQQSEVPHNEDSQTMIARIAYLAF